jgi:hypothetical protein
MPRLCACGCGRPLKGQKSQRFFSDGCRKRANRAPAPRHNTPQHDPGAREPRTQPEPAPGIPGVRALDTNPREVFCAGCGSPMPRLEGPLPVPAYCRECALAA